MGNSCLSKLQSVSYANLFVRFDNISRKPVININYANSMKYENELLTVHSFFRSKNSNTVFLNNLTSDEGPHTY